jgi:hypothetical protein
MPQRNDGDARAQAAVRANQRKMDCPRGEKDDKIGAEDAVVGMIEGGSLGILRSYSPLGAPTR